MAQTHAERQKALEVAESRNIVEVAQSLGMGLVKEGRNYTWSEHDSFVITTKRNLFYWNSRQQGGGSIQLVQLLKECSYKEAVNYLNKMDVGTFESIAEEKKAPFKYYANEHKKMTASIDYLVNERKLSKETVDFFVKQGLIAQTTYKDRKTGKTEPAVVFKHYGFDGKIKGIALQGIWENHELHGKRGYLKKTYGDGFYGLSVRVGNPPTKETATSENPLRIIVFEAPIDLMSYYELHKDTMGDAVLLGMNGLRKGTVSKYIANELGSFVSEEKKATVLDELEKSTMTTDKIRVTLAVDNDTAGKNFIEKTFGEGFLPVDVELPPLLPGKDKSDWNDLLKGTRKQVAAVSKQSAKEETVPEKQTHSIKKNEDKNEKENQSMATDNTKQKQAFSINNDYLKEFHEALGETLDIMEHEPEGTTRYITEEEMTKILDEHFSKIEQLIPHFQTSYDLMNQPTKEEAIQLKEGLIETVEAANTDVKKTFAEALSEKKQTALYNVKEKTNQLRVTIKNSFNKRILTLNDKIKSLVGKIDHKFALVTADGKKVIVADNVQEIKEPVVNVEAQRQSRLVANAQEYIVLKEAQEQLLSSIQTEIQTNPLANISELQEGLKQNQAALEAIEKEIEEMTPSITEETAQQIKTETIDELTTLVKEQERLQQERNQVVDRSDFLRDKGTTEGAPSALETFQKLDQQLTEVTKKIEQIEKGEQQMKQAAHEPVVDPFTLAAASANPKVAVNEATKQSLHTAITNQNNVEVSSQLKSNMEQYFDAENIKTFLDSASQFHQYSPKNVQLIMEQEPHATQVANQNKWETLGYELKEDATPIQIYQPKFVDVRDSEGKVIMKENNQPETTVEFHLTPVYDVSQTTAGKLTEPVTYDLLQKNQFTAAYLSITELTNARIDIRPLSEGNSAYNAETNTLTINEGLGQKETIQTLLNEVTSLYYAENEKVTHDQEVDRLNQEITTYMIASHIGLETSQYDFSSLTQLKEQGFTFEKFNQSINSGTKNAKEMINQIEQKYVKLADVNETKNKFEDRVTKAASDTKRVAENLKTKDYAVEQAATMKR